MVCSQMENSPYIHISFDHLEEVFLFPVLTLNEIQLAFLNYLQYSLNDMFYKRWLQNTILRTHTDTLKQHTHSLSDTLAYPTTGLHRRL